MKSPVHDPERLTEYEVALEQTGVDFVPPEEDYITVAEARAMAERTAVLALSGFIEIVAEDATDRATLGANMGLALAAIDSEFSPGNGSRELGVWLGCSHTTAANRLTLFRRKISAIREIMASRFTE